MFDYERVKIFKHNCFDFQSMCLSLFHILTFERKKIQTFLVLCRYAQVKQCWLGPNYTKEGVAGNDMSRTNIPDIRVTFRYETALEELSTLFHTVKDQLDCE